MQKIALLFVVCYFMHKSLAKIFGERCYGSNLNQSGNCDNIYVWESTQQDFISVLNVTFTKPAGNHVLKGKTVRVLMHKMAPYTIAERNSEELGGFLGDIWEILEEALHFRSEVIAIDYDTGLERIAKGEADLILASGVASADPRNLYYSQPYIVNWYHLFVKRPEARASSASYLKTLNRQLWIASCATFTILTMSLWLTIKLLNSVYKLERNISFPRCLLIVCGGFLNQGFELRTTSWAARSQVIIALVLGYLLLSSMNAVLVAKLAIYSTDLSFNSFRDVRTETTYSLCMRSETFVYKNFTDSNRTILPEWENIVNGPNCLDINHQTNLAKILCHDNVVILENRVVIATIIKEFRIPCDITFLNKRYFQRGNMIIYMRSFKGIKLIETFMLMMKSNGVLQRLERRWIRSHPIEEVSPHKDNAQVSIHHVSGILGFYTTMIIISVLILLLEIAIKKYHNPLKKKTHFLFVI